MKKQLDTDTIMNELKAGSAFFKPSEPPVESDPPIAAPTQAEPAAHSPTPQNEKQGSTIQKSNPGNEERTLSNQQTDRFENKQEDRQVTDQTNEQASHMTILQLSGADIEQLREPAYQAQTFRLTRKEIEWVKDTAYRLSKEIKRGKVAQVDILRISLKLFEGMLTTHKAELLEILNRIK